MKMRPFAWILLATLGCQAHPQPAPNAVAPGQQSPSQLGVSIPSFGSITLAIRWPKYYSTNAIPNNALAFSLRLSDSEMNPVAGFPFIVNRPDDLGSGIQVVKNVKVPPGVYWIGANVYGQKDPLPTMRPILRSGDASLSVYPNERAAAILAFPVISRPTTPGAVFMPDGELGIDQDLYLPGSNNKGNATYSLDVPEGDGGTIGVTIELPPSKQGGVIN